MSKVNKRMTHALHINVKSHILPPLILLTLLFIVSQIIFLYAITPKGHEHQLSYVFHSSEPILSSRKVVLLLQYILSQCVLYLGFIYFLWFFTTGIVELFNLSKKTTIYFCVFFWLNSLINIFSLNLYFVPNSTFGQFIQTAFLGYEIKHSSLFICMLLSSLIQCSILFFTILHIFISTLEKKHLIRHGLMIGFILCILAVYKDLAFFDHHQKYKMTAEHTKKILFFNFNDPLSNLVFVSSVGKVLFSSSDTAHQVKQAAQV